MATTDLRMDEAGTLTRPGPAGRLVRLTFGALCLYYVWGLLYVQGNLLTGDGHIRPLLWNGILPGLFLISYIINIGYARAWKKWPAVASALLLAGAAGVSQITLGTFESVISAWALFGWLVYLFGHLGASFVIAALLGTPGCEMRGIPDLYARVTGGAAREHICPIGPLAPIDRWEAQQSWRRE